MNTYIPGHEDMCNHGGFGHQDTCLITSTCAADRSARFLSDSPLSFGPVQSSEKHFSHMFTHNGIGITVLITGTMAQKVRRGGPPSRTLHALYTFTMSLFFSANG